MNIYMFMFGKVTILLIFFILLPSKVLAEDASQFLSKYFDSPELVGEGRLSFLFWDAYDAKLYATDANWKPGEPLALRLEYLLEIEGQDIAERSVDEIRKQGFTDEEKLSEWGKQMSALFPDVDDGISLTGIKDKSGAAVFYKNSEKIGQIDDPKFAEKFFDIWLSEKTSEPNLRKKLLGLNKKN